MEADLKLVPGKCGCEGCFFENDEICPGYTAFKDPNQFEACTVDGTGMIFVKKEQNDE